MERNTVPLMIDGEEYFTDGSFEIISPSSGQVCAHSSAAFTEDARKAIESSARAFVGWRRSRPAQRRDILLRLAELLQRDWKKLAEYMTTETGSSDGWNSFNVSDSIEIVKDIAGRVSGIEGSVPALADPSMKAMVTREPYGVVFSVASWNSPYILGLRACVLPIAAGNTVVLKGSELSPRCFWAIATLFREAGLPEGVLNYISTSREQANAVTEAIISHPAVKKLSFTGSLAVGRVVSQLAARYVKPVLLELGGQAPVIVWEDADLDLAVNACFAGAFMYAGQCCMSTERVVVHKSVREEFEKKLLAAIKTGFPSGDEARLMIQPGHVDRVKALLQDAEAKGASLSSPIGDATGTDHDASRLNPVVLSGVTPEMDVYNNENFGPIVSIFEVDTEEEALRIANDSECGLGSAVFTRDLLRGFRLAEGIEAGMVHINNMTVHDESALPHGGCKSSGYGRFLTSLGLEEWVRTKTITWKA